MAEVRLIEDASRQLRYRNARLHGWIFVLMGGAVIFAVTRMATLNIIAGVTLVIGLIAMAVGARVGLRRTELTLDVASRSYSGLEGYWPQATGFHGSLSELKHISLYRSRRHTERSGSGHYEWRVQLDFESRDPFIVLRTSNGTHAIGVMRRLSERLGVPAEDRSGRTVIVKEEEILAQLDQVPSAPLSRPGHPGPPPASSAIRWEDREAAAEIVLGRAPLGMTPLLLVLGLAGLTVGTGLLSHAIGLLDLGFARVPAGLGGSLFTLIGLALTALVVLGLVTRRAIREEEDRLLFDVRLLGRTVHTRTILKQQIDRIVRMEIAALRAAPEAPPEASPSVGGVPEVLVRAGDQLVRMARGSDEPTQQWLRQALEFLATR